MDDRASDAATPTGYATVNPFIIADDADGLIEFVKVVFGATERPEARTTDTDGLLLHAELAVGATTIMFAGRKPGWPFTPSLLQVYVDDLDTTLEAARRLHATIVTEPTEFYGDLFSRFRDPWNNLWWVYHHRSPAQDADKDGLGWNEDGADGGDWAADEAWDASSPELRYIHDTLLTALQNLEDPRLTRTRR